MRSDGRRRQKISASAARRIALAAQGFHDPRPTGRIDRRHLRRVIDRIGLLQIDSVNVVVRAHQLPAFSRLGPYPRPLLKDMTERHRELFEYIGHAASFLPMETEPLWRWRMARAGQQAWRSIAAIQRDKPHYVEAILDEVRDRGPLTASELSDGGKALGPWWGWADGKTALEWLFWSGALTSWGRRNSFERVYDLMERVVPANVLAIPTPSIEDAHRALVLRVARALGVATIGDMANYFYLRVDQVRARVGELVEEGALVPVEVDGWGKPAYLDAAARIPRRVHARALVAPFDPLVYDRARVERVFGMRYRIEIYVPAPKRVYGYYVLPFLLGDTLVARVDLKADRARSALLVQGAHAEVGVDHAEVGAELSEELRLLADWLELERVEIRDKGDLAAHLAGVRVSVG